MKIKFKFIFPKFKFWKKPEATEKKLVSKGMSFWKKAADYADVFKLLLAVALAYAIGSRFGSNQWEIMILGYFLFVLLKKVDSRLSAGLALVFLALTPVFLYAVDEDIAETLAVYAFYFLCITVVQEIKELWGSAGPKKAEKIPELKKKMDIAPVLQKASTFREALKADFFGSVKAVGEYWIVFWMLLAFYAIMLFFLKFEMDWRVSYALVGFAAISALSRLWQWWKSKTIA